MLLMYMLLLLLLGIHIRPATGLLCHFLASTTVFIKRRPCSLSALRFSTLSLRRLHWPPLRLIDTRQFQSLAPPARIERRRIRRGKETTKFDRAARETCDFAFCREL